MTNNLIVSFALSSSLICPSNNNHVLSPGPSIFQGTRVWGLCVVEFGGMIYWRGSDLYALYTLRPHTARQYEFGVLIIKVRKTPI